MEKEKVAQQNERDMLPTRKFIHFGIKSVFYIALAASIFHIYLMFTGVLESFKMRAIHLAFLMPLAFLVYPLRKKSSKNIFSVIDFTLFIVSISALLYLSMIEYDRFLSRWAYVDPLTALDIVAGVVLIICVLEATRRVIGSALAIIAVAALLYGLFGENLPGILAHSGFSFTRTIDHLVFTTEGIFGIPLGASATFIFLFVLFGEFLVRSGGGQFFIDLAYSIAGKSKGGPAKMSIFSSALMGTVSGSAVGNVASTGVYTIPLMRKVGYTRAFSGAVEATASTGGQILPPVMGAAAFIIAEYLGMPYIEVAAAALIPALLFFLGVLCMVHFQAGKMNLSGLPKEELPKLKEVLLKQGHLSIPLIVILVVLFNGFTPYLAAGYALISVVIVSAFQAATRMSIKDIIYALSKGAQSSILIAVTCACAGIVVGIASQTGIGSRFSSIVIHLSQDILLLALPLVMIASIILGMGIPTTAAYIMVSAIAVPALVELNVLPLAAHLFALYFAVVSVITPPVAMGAFAASAIAGSKPMYTGLLSMKIGAAAYVVPYLFVFNNELLLIGSNFSIAFNIITAMIGIVAMAASLSGYFMTHVNVNERVLLIVISLALINDTGPLISIISGLVFIAFILFQKRSNTLHSTGINNKEKNTETIS